MDDPSPVEVRAQIERLYVYGRFRGAKLRRLLAFIVEQWLADGGKQLTEMYIGRTLNDEPLTFEESSDKWGYPRTRANLAHVRNRLRQYYETDGYQDRVIIKLNPGSYAPVVAYNPISAVLPDLDINSERLILRAKTALDARTFRAAWRAFEYYTLLIDLPNTPPSPRRTSNIVFIPIAIASVFPNMTKAFRSSIEAGIANVRTSGIEPWECTFADACGQACYQHKWQRALSLLETAIANSQGEAAYYWWYTALLASQGGLKKAIDLLKAAVRHFARTNIAVRTDLAMLQTMDGQYVDAEETLSGALDFASADNPLLACHFAVLYEAQDRLMAAVPPMAKWFDKVSQIDMKSVSLDQAFLVDWHSFLCGMHILICGRIGAVNRAAELLDSLLRRKAKFDRTSSVEIAVGHIGLGRYDEAVSWLTRAAFEESDPFAMWFNVFPPLRHLHGHRGFHELLQKLRLQVQRGR